MYAETNSYRVETLMLEERPIVVVEDNAKERELIATALTDYDICRNVVVLGSGSEMLGLMSDQGTQSPLRQLPSLIILDLNLKDMHGLDVLKMIRKNEDFAAVPVVIFSGSESALDAAVARELQADGFIMKPGDFHDMQSTVRSLAVFWASQVRTTLPSGTSSND